MMIPPAGVGGRQRLHACLFLKDWLQELQTAKPPR